MNFKPQASFPLGFQKVSRIPENYTTGLFEAKVYKINGNRKTVYCATAFPVPSGKYPKWRLRVSRYMVHDEKGIASLGDLVLLRHIGSQFISKRKHHEVVKILDKDPTQAHLLEYPELKLSKEAQRTKQVQWLKERERKKEI